jgi:hypothetical protein
MIKVKSYNEFKAEKEIIQQHIVGIIKNDLAYTLKEVK